MRFTLRPLVSAVCCIGVMGLAHAYTPGTYEAMTNGKNGPVTIVTTFSADRIEKIEWKDHYETDYIGVVAMEKMRDQILEKQHLAIDTISGATVSSSAVLRGVGLCAGQAGVDSSTLLPDEVVIDPATLPSKTLKTQIVVIGAGGAGLSAATSAAQAGASVLVLEKAQTMGGNTALSHATFLPTGSIESVQAQWRQADQTAARGGDTKRNRQRARLALLREESATKDWLAQQQKTETCARYPAIESKETQGRTLTQTLLNAACAQPKVSIQTGTRVYALRTDKNGRVTGVVAHDGKTRFEIDAQAVIIASGGFAKNIEMMASYVPILTARTEFADSVPTATGDGIRLAQSVGAKASSDHWALMQDLRPRYEALRAVITTEKAGRDLVFVNERSQRFVNEAQASALDHMAQQRVKWVIFDSSDAEKVKIVGDYLDYNVAVHGKDWRELARRMGTPADKLAQTMRQYNADAKKGIDTKFHKDRQYLRALTKAPFYAVRVEPQLMGTIGGIETNAMGQVLSVNGKAIEGLWAAGEVANQAYLHRARFDGAALSGAITTGRIAGREAAKATQK